MSIDIELRDDDRVQVVAAWQHKEQIKQVPGARWDAERKHWHVPRSWAACVQLRSIFGNQLHLGGRLREWAAEERATRVEPSLLIRDALQPGPGAPPRAGLYPFQAADAEWLRVAGSALLGNDMGTGKTISTLAALPGGGPFLVICPNSVKRNWERECYRWRPELEPLVIEGGAATRRKQLATTHRDSLVIINFEAVRLHSRLAPYGSVRLKRCKACGGEDSDLPPTKCEAHPKELNELGFEAVVVDEAHRLKDPKAKQTRATWAVCHGSTVQRRIGLTGTPIANHVGDLWSVMHAIAPAEYPVRSRFLDRYALLTWNQWGGMDIAGLNPAHREEFYRIFDSRFRRVTKQQVLKDLPPKVRTIRHAPLLPKMRKSYEELAGRLVTRLEDGSVLIAPNQLAAATRLLQLSSSYGELQEDGSFKLTEPSPKLDVLGEILAELENRPVAVCAVSRQLIELAAARLEEAEVAFGTITGSDSQSDRDRTLSAFQDGKLQVLLFTIQAGGVGLTMTAADTIVFLQRSWSLLENKQAEDRVHRIGSEVHEAINVIDVVAPGTIEEEIQIPRLYEKLERLEEINRDGQLELEEESLL